MDISLPELLVVGVLAVLVFGKELPGAARKLSKVYSKFRLHLSEMKGEIERHAAVEPEEPIPIETPPPPPRTKSRPRKRRRRRRVS